ncbi:MAG TPA: hypothetical protein VFX17_01395 [Patescibacteria group bacterium]|nr:hypothetical protein [Patescibacteria group bacterium]
MFYDKYYRHRNNSLGIGLLAFAAGAVAWALFGEKIRTGLKESEKFQDLKDEVYEKASNMADLTREKYDKFVDEAASQYATVRGISQNELRDLVSDLKWHWHRIKSSWKNNRYSDAGNSFGEH